MHVCGVYVICMFECVTFGVCVVHTHVSWSTCALQRPTSRSWWKSLLVFLLCCICQASRLVNFTFISPEGYKWLPWHPGPQAC